MFLLVAGYFYTYVRLLRRRLAACGNVSHSVKSPSQNNPLKRRKDPTPRCSGPQKLDWFSSWFDGALKRAQAKDESIERVTPHGLRHVAAGLLVNAGANVKAVQAQMGHTSATMPLNTYSDLFDDGLDVVAQR